MKNCVFCKIVEGKSPAKLVASCETALAIIPNKIEVKGHCVILTKNHFQDIFDIPGAQLSKLMIFTKEIALDLKSKTGASGINILHASGADAQQSVLHFHLHLLPRYKDDGIDAWPTLPGHV